MFLGCLLSMSSLWSSYTHTPHHLTPSVAECAVVFVDCYRPVHLGHSSSTDPFRPRKVASVQSAKTPPDIMVSPGLPLQGQPSPWLSRASTPATGILKPCSSPLQFTKVAFSQLLRAIPSSTRSPTDLLLMQMAPSLSPAQSFL